MKALSLSRTELRESPRTSLENSGRSDRTHLFALKGHEYFQQGCRNHFPCLVDTCVLRAYPCLGRAEFGSLYGTRFMSTQKVPSERWRATAPIAIECPFLFLIRS
jgi:hypothetical protein